MTRPKQQRYERTPRGAYVRHKQNAKRRGVPFHFTFEQWHAMWAPYWARKFDVPANDPNSLVMLRRGDVGAYATDNCYIGTRAENGAEAFNRFRTPAYDGAPGADCPF